jgi:hypothetical protein
MDHAHPEAVGTARHRLADAAEADDAERLAEERLPEQLIECPAFPLPRSNHALALAHSTGRREHQRERHLRGCLGEHVGRVRGDDAACGERGEVEVVDSHRAVRDHLQLRCASEDTRVDPVE